MAQAEEAVQTRRQQKLAVGAVRRQPGSTAGLQQGVQKKSTVSTRIERWHRAGLETASQVPIQKKVPTLALPPLLRGYIRVAHQTQTSQIATLRQASMEHYLAMTARLELYLRVVIRR